MPPVNAAAHPTAQSIPEPIGVVLLIAYHYPPCTGSSGLLRTLKFSRYLPEFGWSPVVLTVHPRAYESCDPRSAATPHGVPVVRAFALDTKRHLGWRGAYLDWLALPDRWVTWLAGAIPSGLRAIRKHDIQIIYSTFPISTAILAGLVLHRLSGKPWVVDLRDSMTEKDYPSDVRLRRVRRWIEQRAMKFAARVIFTSSSARRLYLDRYPNLLPEKCLLIPNGFDEEDFSELNLSGPASSLAGRPIRLLHTGLIYPSERDPRPFFRALARLKAEGSINSAALAIVFRASGSEDVYQRAIDDLGIGDLLQLQPHIPYRQALGECAEADGLLLFQAANCDHQIPAKAYEYLRLRKPIFALTTRTGDTGALLEEVGGSTIVDLADEDAIYRGLPSFLAALRSGTHSLPDSGRIQRYARRSQAKELAHCLSKLKEQDTAENRAKIGKLRVIAP